MQSRNKKGQFDSKSESKRVVKSLRVSPEIWEEAGIKANERGITRADLFEEYIKSLRADSDPSNTRYNDRIKLLEEALKLKANAGGAIKKKIREYLEIIK